MNYQLLKSHGIDYHGGLARCLNDEEFYKLLLNMFLQDDCLLRAKKAFTAGDGHTLFGCMHELKGSSGNIDLTELYAAAIPLVELLRNNEEITDEVTRLFGRICEIYEDTREGITQALAES